MGSLFSKSKSFAVVDSPASKSEGQDEVEAASVDECSTEKELLECDVDVPFQEGEEELSPERRKALPLADMSRFESDVSLAGSDRDMEERLDLLRKSELAENAMDSFVGV
ncbi:hypothetical protein TTRE_0000037901 [Trichuris trichiura]|uniref:Uncharacterized protein n=1 Tax=Trichuris trichiura TaxID=36087 RepID=A0A077Z0J6_TRITR|nr:hypothetical protein TTRE_0000037901 [Trichuris trichiura]